METLSSARKSVAFTPTTAHTPLSTCACLPKYRKKEKLHPGAQLDPILCPTCAGYKNRARYGSFKAKNYSLGPRPMYPKLSKEPAVLEESVVNAFHAIQEGGPVYATTLMVYNVQTRKHNGALKHKGWLCAWWLECILTGRAAGQPDVIVNLKKSNQVVKKKSTSCVHWHLKQKNTTLITVPRSLFSWRRKSNAIHKRHTVHILIKVF